MQDEAERWNQRWQASEGPIGAPHPLVMSLGASLRVGARVLDVASGRGRQALAMARAGHAVTAVDISDVGLARLSAEAHAEGVDVACVVGDLSLGLPAQIGANFDAIVCIDYLDVDLFAKLGSYLAPGGRLVVSVATVTNLQRNAHPSRRFLAPDTLDLAALTGLWAVRAEVAWREDGRHTLWFVGEQRQQAAATANMGQAAASN